MIKKRLLLTALLALLPALLSAFLWLDVGHYFSLDYLKQSHAGFALLYAQQPLRVVLIFSLLYALTAALPLPGATLLKLAAGALFGQMIGVLIVSFASSLSATLAMLAARYWLRDWVEKNFAQQTRKMKHGLSKDGAFYLFSLRLMPLFPFFAVNLLMGLSTIRIRTFYLVSQLGMLFATVVYVNAGTQLAKIESLKDIVSPSFLLSLAAVGLFPLLVKKSLVWHGRLQRERRLASPADKT